MLAQLLGAARDAGLIATSPATGARLPRVQRAEMAFLTPVELDALADAIGVRYRATVLAMAWGTLRIGEAAGLRLIDVDLAAGTLRVANAKAVVSGHLVEGPPKTNAGRRTMSMPASVMADLGFHLEHYAGSYTSSAPRTAARCTPISGGPRCGTRPWTGPAWGHSGPMTSSTPALALLTAAGVDPSEIARRAGHTSVAFTYDRYGHLLPGVDKEAATKLDTLRARATG